VKNDDVVVFNYPDGDTVALEAQSQSYYEMVRECDKGLKIQNGAGYQPNDGWNYVQTHYTIKARPVDKRENYIKRCVAIPGDKLQVKNGQLYINDKPANNPERIQYQYIVYTNGTEIGKKTRQKININEEDIMKPSNLIETNSQGVSQLDQLILRLGTSTDYNTIKAYSDSITKNPFNYLYMLSADAIKKIKALPITLEVRKLVVPDTVYDDRVFPQNPNYRWNRDNYGPIVMPKAGVTVKIDTLTLPLYRRIIEVYEGNRLRVEGATVFINDKPATSYTFKMGYYWMMGDNRHNSADSRYWGFVPEDHIVGKAVFVWLSLDKFKGWFDGKIRWSRMFRGVR
jgi:signal peptidase I